MLKVGDVVVLVNHLFWNYNISFKQFFSSCFSFVGGMIQRCTAGEITSNDIKQEQQQYTCMCVWLKYM